MVSKQGRRQVSILLVFVLLITMLMPAMAYGAEASLKDISGSYAQQEIQSLIQQGIVNGYEDGTFRPDQAMTRAEFAKILSLALGLKEKPEAAASFKDVAASSWYQGYVGAITELGITEGTSPGRFSPDSEVTREELIVFFIRALDLEIVAGQLPANAELADLNKVSPWAQTAVSLAYKIGFINGVEQNGAITFHPQDHAQRQALARLTYEFIHNKNVLVKKAQILAVSEIPSPVSKIEAITNTTVEVSFYKEIEGIDLSDFAFNGLKVSKADLKAGSKTIVVVTTEPQAAGTVYTLIYKGLNSMKSFTGMASFAGGGAPGGGAPSNSTLTDTEKLNKGGTYTSLTINSSGTLGPVSGSTVITGTLTLNPGENGQITLRNVEAARIEVLSGSPDTIKLQNTIINTLKIASTNQNHPTRIETLDGSQVTTTLIQSKAIIESTAGSLGMIQIGYGAAGQEVELRGTIKGNITVDSASTQIKIAAPKEGGVTSVSTLQVGSEASINVADGATLGNISVTSPHAAIELAGKGQIRQVTVSKEAEGATLNLSTANITSLRLEANVKLEGDAATIGAVPIVAAPGVSVEVPANVLVELKANVVAVVEGIGEITEYSSLQDAQIQAAEILVNNALVLGIDSKEIAGYEIILQKAKDEITVYALRAAVNQLKINYHENDSQASVSHDIILPAIDQATGVTITWTTSDASLITSSGEVTRPAIGSADAAVVLTATLAKNNKTETITFHITVAAQQPVAELEALSVEPNQLSLDKGESRDLKVFGIYSDRTSSLLIGKAAFTSTDPKIASVTSAGTVTALSGGTTEIIVSYMELSERISVTVKAPLEIHLKAEAGNREATLYWTSIGDGVTYQVYHSRSSGSYETPLVTVQSVTYTAKGLLENTDYYFIVKAWTDGNAYTSNEVHVVPTDGTVLQTAKPVVSGAIYPNGFELWGTAEGAADNKLTEIFLSKMDGTSVAYSCAAASGKFEISSVNLLFYNRSLSAGEEIKITARAYGKITSEPVIMTVLPTTGETAIPAITDVVNEVSNITGTAEPGAAVHMEYRYVPVEPGTGDGGSNGVGERFTRIAAVKAASDGRFTFHGYEGQFETGERLTITAVALGKATSQPVQLIVQPAPQAVTPTVSGSVYTNGWKLSGFAEPVQGNDYAYVSLQTKSGFNLSSAGVRENGSFTMEGINYTDINVTPGESVYFVFQKYGMKKSEPVELIVQAAGVKTAAVMLDVTNELLVSGWAEFGSYVTIVGGTDFKQMIAASSTTGAFTLPLPEGYFKEGDKLSISSTVIGQTTSDPVWATLQEAPVTAAPTVSGTVYNNFFTLWGTTEAMPANSHTIIRLSKPDGGTIYYGYHGSDHFLAQDFLDSNALLPEGMELLLTAQTLGKKKSAPVRVMVQAANGQTAQPVEVDAKEALIRGTAEPSSYVQLLYARNGGVARSMTMASSYDGSFSFVTSRENLQAGDTVTIIALTSGKAASDPVQVVVQASAKSPTPVVAGTVYTNVLTLSGTTHPVDENITVYVTTVTGSYIASIGVYRGEFSSSSLIDEILVPGQEVLVTSEATGFKKSDPVRFTVRATEGQTSVPSYTGINESNCFIGTAEPGALVKLKNDTRNWNSRTIASASGTYSIYVPADLLKLGDQLSLTSTVVGKSTSDTVHITVIGD